MLDMFRFLLCNLLTGHGGETVIEENVVSRECLLRCVKCGHVKVEKMSFGHWWHLISDQERRDFLDQNSYNPFCHELKR